jgi:hypothetical protein
MSRYPRMFLATTAAVIAAFVAMTTIAEARQHRHRAAPHTLTVKKRPFTDSGRVVSRGSESRYVGDTHYSGVSPTLGRAPNSYGAETLPGRFDVPGARPLFNF